MVRINCEPIKKQEEELSRFLEEKLGLKVKAEGSVIVVEPVEVSKFKVYLKTYLKRFLFAKGLRRKYSLSIQGEEIRFLPTGEKEEE